MKTLYITRGLPGSGKTTWAKEYQRKNPNTTRINNDDLRDMMHLGKYSKHNEVIVKAVTERIAEYALGAGHHVIIDNTHLPERWVTYYQQVARRLMVGFKVQDFRDVPLHVCLERNLNRPNAVPEKVIRSMHAQFLRPEPIVQNHSLPYAIIVDIDGTLAHKGDRSPYDMTRVLEDTLDQNVYDFVLDVKDNRWKVSVILLSGRGSEAREDTITWLETHLVPYDHLFMRAEGDTRPDYIVKRELFDKHIRDKYYVELVLDDRQQVVDMWRDLGLTVWQVAEGNF